MAKKKQSAASITDWTVPVFGVRHLSPSGAWHLRRYLDRVRPEIVLIEGLSDANSLIRDITRAGSVPPIAILAYTESLPVRTLVYPFSKYSPEYQAIVWAKENRAEAEFIDLPSDIFLGFKDIAATVDVPADGDAEANDQSAEESDETVDVGQFDEARRRINLYEQFAQKSGENDYETYWERRFEHNLSDESYRLAAFEFGRGLRELETDTRLSQAENLVREGFRKRSTRVTRRTGLSRLWARITHP